MILDTIENATKYYNINKNFAEAFDFLLHSDIESLPEGKYNIDGDDIFAIIAKEQGRKKKDALLEIHEKYIDIQYILNGTDTMGWKPKASCNQPTDKYDSEKDLQFFADLPDAWFATNKGVFAIFFPEDAHAPLVSDDKIHKVIVKIKI